MSKNCAPVWIKGKITRDANRSITIKALDKHDRTRDVVISRTLIVQTRRSGEEDEVLVPQWLAYKEKLNWTPVVNQINEMARSVTGHQGQQPMSAELLGAAAQGLILAKRDLSKL